VLRGQEVGVRIGPRRDSPHGQFRDSAKLVSSTPPYPASSKNFFLVAYTPHQPPPSRIAHMPPGNALHT
jgi:hypothetical protein